MTQMKEYHENKNTFFIQAIDQNYENEKITNENADDFSKENFLESGELKLNLDFIDFSDELRITKNEHKKSEGNFSYSCESSDSTEFDSLSIKRIKSDQKFLSLSDNKNKKNFKMRDFLCQKFEDNTKKNLSSEIQKMKENLKKEFLENSNIIIFNSAAGNANNNNISSFANFNLPLLQMPINHQNQQKSQIQAQLQMNFCARNFPIHGFFQQQQQPNKPNLNNLNLESSIFKKERKFSYQPAYTGSNYLEF